MPIYEYICPQCKTKFEEWQNINESSALVACPECQTLSERIISNTSFILKGEGWYVTEYGNKKNTNSKTTEKKDQNEQPKSDLAEHSDLSSEKPDAKTSAKADAKTDANNSSSTKADAQDKSASKSETSGQTKKDEPKAQKKVEKNND